MMYDLKLEQAHVQLVINALGEIPLKIALPAYAAIHGQVEAQDAAAKPRRAKKAKPTP